MPKPSVETSLLQCLVSQHLTFTLQLIGFTPPRLEWIFQISDEILANFWRSGGSSMLACLFPSAALALISEPRR